MRQCFVDQSRVLPPDAMPTLKTYQKPEAAFIDAGFLCSMGIEAVVSQDPAYGGLLFGATESPYRLEVSDAQLEQALALHSQRPVEEPPQAQPTYYPVDAVGLHRFFRFILIYDTACCVLFTIYGHLLNPELPKSVSEFLASLALSDGLWRFSYDSYWPLFTLRLLSNILCYFYIPFGRSLFAFTTVWSIVTYLGPPPMIFGPYYGFFGGIEGTLASIALALMYWSPVRERFFKRPQAKSPEQIEEPSSQH